MNRRKLREQIFKLLFRIEFNSVEEMGEQCALFFQDDENEADVQDTEYISNKFQKIMDQLTKIDALINQEAIGWTVKRMGKVDLTIIRLAIFEIMHDEEVPTSVAINEAVELAKKYGQDESPSFINGVLAKFAK